MTRLPLARFLNVIKQTLQEYCYLNFRCSSQNILAALFKPDLKGKYFCILDCHMVEAHNNFMNDRILQLLELPRKLVHGEMELEGCPHDGMFDSRDHQCIDCPQGPECQWLCSNDEFASLQTHSTRELLQALDFAIVYIHGALIKWDHQPDSCACAVCNWHRQARETYDTLFPEPAHNNSHTAAATSPN